MINHHPDKNMLMEYAAGTLDLAKSIAVNAHLHYCSICRHNLYSLEQLGGALLEGLEPTPVDDDCYESLMARIDAEEERMSLQDSKEPAAVQKSLTLPPILDQEDTNELPLVVKQLIAKQRPIKWKRLSSSLKVCRLAAGQSTHEIALHRINAGGKTFEHDHKGQEFTVVLKGSFSDEDGIYQQGDFISRQPGDVHRPLAAKNEDCLCLTVLEAPVSLTGILTRFLNPFQRIYAA